MYSLDKFTFFINELAYGENAFFLEGIDWFVESKSAHIELKKRLSQDKRFICIGDIGDSQRVIYLPKKKFIESLVRMNLKGFEAGINRISNKFFFNTISHMFSFPLTINEETNILLKSREYCLASRLSDTEALFIIADLLALMRNLSIEAISDIIITCSENKKGTDIQDKRIEKIIYNLFSENNNRNLKMFLLRWGLIDGQSRTLQQVANIYGITRERVRQIEDMLIKKGKIAIGKNNELIKIFLSIIINKGGARIFNKSDGKIFYQIKFLSAILGLAFKKINNTKIWLLGVDYESRKHTDKAFTWLLEVTNGKRNKISKSKNVPKCFDIDFIASNINNIEYFSLCPEDIKKWKCISLPIIEKSLKWVDVIYSILKNIGKPAHYVEISLKCKSLYPNRNNTPRNIMSILSRIQKKKENPWVWTGKKGVYVLREWGIKDHN